MTRHETKARHDVVCTLYKRGKTISEITEICGYSDTGTKNILAKAGLYKPSRSQSKERELKAVEMIKQGYNTEEIAEALGYARDTSVYEIARRHNLSVVTGKALRKQQLHEEIIKLKEQGSLGKEIAERLGISEPLVWKYAKGINSQKCSPEEQRERAIKQNAATLSQREAKAIEQIEQSGFEYIGGYTNTDSYVSVKCPKCGTVFERSMVSFRHSVRTIICPGCVEITKKEKLKAEEEKRTQAEQERIRKAEEKKKRNEEKEQAKWHECPVCGEMTKRPKYCSDKCQAKALNKTHEIRRDRKIKGALVDKDITLQRLYERDHGVCYLCGEVCDWEDKEERNGIIICGNRYPSIDHVVPLARGGEHSWQNVKLAHRICNALKGDKHQKIASSLTISE